MIGLTGSGTIGFGVSIGFGAAAFGSILASGFTDILGVESLV